MFDPTRPFAGLKVLVTGNLGGLSRAGAQERITELGGEPVQGVSRTTGLVIVADGAGVSKMAKVRDLDLPVITGDEFEQIVESPLDHPVVVAAAASGRVGTPYSLLAADFEPDVEPDADVGVAWADRHLVGQAAAGRRDGLPGVEYRMWCLKCKTSWTGESGPASIDAGCPNDENRTKR